MIATPCLLDDSPSPLPLVVPCIAIVISRTRGCRRSATTVGMLATISLFGLGPFMLPLRSAHFAIEGGTVRGGYHFSLGRTRTRGSPRPRARRRFQDRAPALIQLATPQCFVRSPHQGPRGIPGDAVVAQRGRGRPHLRGRDCRRRCSATRAPVRAAPSFPRSGPRSGRSRLYRGQVQRHAGLVQGSQELASFEGAAANGSSQLHQRPCRQPPLKASELI
mmetsp:Transcript_72655/g.160646  ORF Transcript_72655/g.160646 Transcript_72655/m.160646 type:complete len:220 (-) Transcript_72655:54-713(-)